MTYTAATKQRKLIHPLWTHLPAIAALITFLVFLVTAGPLPGRAPVHFDFQGEPDRYGSPWELIGIFLGLSVFFIALSGFIDELWARQEKKKSFNWLCWLDDLTVGWMSGIGIGYLLFLGRGREGYATDWLLTGAMAGVVVALSLLIEWLRPYRPYVALPLAPDTAYSEAELAQKIKHDTAFVYWDNQNPAYVTLISIFLPLVFIVTTVIIWLAEGWITFVFIYTALSVLVTLALISFIYGGQRTLVTRQQLTVRWGLAGFKVLRLNTSEIESVSMMEYAPLRDFGGYGIRFGRGMTAYFLRGSRGVAIALVNGKKYLVGSDHPERLLSVLRLVTGRKEQGVL